MNPAKHRLLFHILRDPAAFSEHGLRSPLRTYQVEPARAILAAVFDHTGGVFVVEMARQAGKNELQARLEAQLLVVFKAQGGQIVKASPTLTRSR